MRLLDVLLLLAMALSLGCVASTAQPTGIVTLPGLRHQARPLLIFAPKPDDPQLEIQLRRLSEHAPDVAEREVVAIAVPYQSPSTTAAQLSTTESEACRRRFHVTPGDFVVILIGKDGEEKLRSAKPLTIETLRETIDAMPMRKEEMRKPKS